VDADTEDVPTANVAVVAPAATATVAGTVAAVLLLAMDTEIPPAGALLDSVTRPCALVPPVTLDGVTVTL
jgi:hypothetical protein